MTTTNTNANATATATTKTRKTRAIKPTLADIVSVVVPATIEPVVIEHKGLKNEAQIMALAEEYKAGKTKIIHLLKEAIGFLVKGDDMSHIKLDAKSSDYDFWLTLKSYLKVLNSGKAKMKLETHTPTDSKIKSFDDIGSVKMLRDYVTDYGKACGAIQPRNVEPKTETKIVPVSNITDDMFAEYLMRLSDENLEKAIYKIQNILALREKSREIAINMANKRASKNVA